MSWTAEAARKYHNENRHIYFAFEREALKLIEKGRTHYSPVTIIEFIRHNTAISARPDADEFKINNNIRAYYSRLFAYRFPAKKDFFQFRNSGFDSHVFVGMFDFYEEEVNNLDENGQSRLF